MLSTAADLVSLAQLAPWLAVGVLALFASGWVYRQSRRQVNAVEARAQASAARQGKRLGELEKLVALEKLRRQQVEWVLLDEGVDLPLWPADGPDQPRPRRAPTRDDRDDRDDRDLGSDYTADLPIRTPVPPLPQGLAGGHRR
jgi:hypothetical protein